MNKSLSLILGLILIGTLNLVNAEEIIGNYPLINITNITHLDKSDNYIEKSYYSSQKIEVVFEVYDQEGWKDIFDSTLTLDNVTLDCQKINTINNNTAEYFCSLTILDWMKGEYNLSLIVVDNGGLITTAFVGNYYFNSNMTLNKTDIKFSEFVMGNESETEWINVSISTPTDNPYKVLLSGKNLYPYQVCYEKEVKTCKIVCERVYKNVTKKKKVCEEMPYNETRSKKECKRELVNGKLKTVCNRIYYLVTKYKKSCHYKNYSESRYVRVCGQKCELKNVTKCDVKSELKNCGGNNYLSLDNFKYLLENSTWKNVLNIDNKEIIFIGKGDGGFNIKFKVEIPGICYGNYTLNRSNIFFELHE